MSFRNPSAPDDSDLWFVERNGTHWSAPRSAGAAVNSQKHETYPSVAGDGTLYFGSDRDGGRGASDIYVSKLRDGEYTAPVNVEALNTDANDGNPYIAPDQSYIVFNSNRPGGEGDSDLYISFNRGGTWTAPIGLGKAVNTPAVEYCPMVSPDGQRLYFTRFRAVDPSVAPTPSIRDTLTRLDSPGNGLGDIYAIEWPALLAQLQAAAAH
jgi:Tol biopolymer transport system component